MHISWRPKGSPPACCQPHFSVASQALEALAEKRALLFRTIHCRCLSSGGWTRQDLVVELQGRKLCGKPSMPWLAGVCHLFLRQSMTGASTWHPRAAKFQAASLVGCRSASRCNSQPSAHVRPHYAAAALGGLLQSKLMIKEYSSRWAPHTAPLCAECRCAAST